MYPIIVSLMALTAPLAADPASDIQQLNKDHTQFAFSLYPALTPGEENLVFSPLSIANCLSMVYLGARGETEAQMQKALHLEIDRKNIAKTSCLLNQSLQPSNETEKTYTLKTANAVWVDQDTFLLTDFRYSLEKQFQATLSKINFSMPSNALLEINDWISQQTQGKITHLLTTDDINEKTRLVLTNAVYFQGNWRYAFDPKLTQDWPFHPSSDSSITVKMMHQTRSLPFFENQLLQAVAIPFIGTSSGGGDLSFVLLLPKSAENLTTMTSELTSEFSHWLSALSPQKVELKLPKFTLNSRFDLGEPLQRLGMEDAFDSSANFVGIDGMRDLLLNKVIHQTFFALDEAGVTAAAATAASMNVTSSLEKTPPVQLIADHPFLFFIVDLKSQEMLFMGKILQPE